MCGNGCKLYDNDILINSHSITFSPGIRSSFWSKLKQIAFINLFNRPEIRM